MGHIDPCTGRNKRETGKLLKRARRGGNGNGIRMVGGRPVEKRIDQVRRRRVRPVRFS